MRRSGVLVLALIACASGPPGSEPAVPAEASTHELRSRAEPLPMLDLEGKPVDLRNLAAPVMVIELWASWCEPCVENLPRFDALRRAYADDTRIRFLAVSIDAPDDYDLARAVARERAPNLPTYFATSGVSSWLMPHDAKGHLVMFLPLMVIIDAESELHRRADVETDRSGVSLDEVIQGALAGDMPPSLPSIHAQRNPRLPPARPGVRMGIKAGLSPQQLERVLDRVKRVYRQDPAFTEEDIAQRVEAIRQRYDEGERAFDLDFGRSTPSGSRSPR